MPSEAPSRIDAHNYCMMVARNKLAGSALTLEWAMGLGMGKESSFLRAKEGRPLWHSSSSSSFPPRHQFVVG